MNFPYDSRNSFYKSPFGAVELRTKIHFRILLPKETRCISASLAIKNDCESNWEYVNMFWSGSFGNNNEIWECDFIPTKLGLYWHGFRLSTSDGVRYINPSFRSKGEIKNNPGGAWQITVYEKNFDTPKWPVGGVMYQIFPDRFFFSGNRKQNVYPDKIIRENWGETPNWQPNERGVITNSDFFMGDLQGIIEKLDYLEELGVTCIYLNPIFEAYSNHRYDTANYEKVDPILGTNEDFEKLCKAAKKRGIHVINDGVFSHTGSDSIYFNRNGRYKNDGAYQSQSSPYYSWYKFDNWPYNYHSWWGFDTLPEVNELDPSYNEYINGKDGIIQKWIKAGNSGWRLDVADELPDGFLENMRKAVKSENPEGLIIGEVWEDASNKESYGSRRQFLLGNQLDSVMNYPFRCAILDFLRGADGADVIDRILAIIENYPRPVLRVLMNMLSTHDTERAITVIAGDPLNGRGRDWQANTKLSKEQRARGLRLMKVAAGILYTLPGFPCIYYGDEAGMEGYRDPFNRCCYPWGQENTELVNWHKSLGSLRKSCSALCDGEINDAYSHGSLLSYIRHDEHSALFCAFNYSEDDLILDVPPGYSKGTPLFGTKQLDGKFVVPAEGCAFVMINS
ncbi:MAG: glycoside hydrolase family 13 protein [Bacillota bacterium]|nr:glycoside hydrolase family 13 protein [Bacillota bacterium]